MHKEHVDTIFGTMNMKQYIYRSDKFPKMEVSLYQAPDCPEKIIAYDYLECIENRNLVNPSQIDIKEARQICQWVLKGGHTPSLESIYLLFNIRGISKVVSHQLVRHRIGVSIGQRTQRANSKEYLGKFFEGQHYILPKSIVNALADDDKWPDLDKKLNICFGGIQDLYNDLLKAGVSQDEARYIIPQASETSMNFKVMYNALMHVASQRLCTLMQEEMIEVVRLMVQAVKDYNEFLGEWLQPNCLLTGICNRNENNQTEKYPKGICHYTIDDTIPVRNKDDTFDLTKFSKDGSKE